MSTKRKKKKSTNRKYYKTHPKENLDIANIVSTKKLKISFAFILIILLLLIIRIFYLQVIDGSRLSNLANKQQVKSEEISSKRGNIYDSTGAALAISETVDTISINPKKIVVEENGKINKSKTTKLKETIAQGLSEIFELSYDEVLAKENSSSSSETIIRKVEEDKVNNLRNWMKENNITAGINIDEDTKRYYPYGTLAAQLIGTCGTDNQGLAGIESSYDSILKGTSGEVITSKTASQREIPNSEQSFIEAENGYDLTLTIDANIQSVVEKNLQEGVETTKASKGGNCIVMNPQNGQILAMASYPTYDLNNPRTPTSYYADNYDNLTPEEKSIRIQQMWRIRPVSESYVPGSVFKLITASTALEENITKTDVEHDFICNGSENVNGTIISCWRDEPHGPQGLRTALMNSCNPSLIQLGKRIGKETLFKYIQAFGLTSKTGIGLSGESAGRFYPNIDSINSVELATMSFGENFTVTPLQLCTAVSAIVNEGYLLKAQIIQSITNTDTGEIKEFDKEIVRQVISTQTANQVKDIMYSVVQNGTGKSAKVSGYSIGGKSGTSQPVAGDPDSVYVASFVGIAPIENTQVVVLVALQGPQGPSHQGGQTAAPIVHNILEKILPYLGLEPNVN